MTSNEASTEPRSGDTKRVPMWAGLFALLTLTGLAVTALVLLLAGILEPREPSRRMSCRNNLFQLSLAMHTYHEKYDALPPAYTVDARGQPLHSWRTLLLPFLDYQDLYDEIDLSKPWDDPVNQAAAQTTLQIYRCHSMGADSPATPYVAVVDPAGLMTGPNALSFRDIADGLQNTVMFVETDKAHAVHWMSPTDIDLRSFLAVTDPAAGANHRAGYHLVLGDGSIVYVTKAISAELRTAMVTRSGKEFPGPRVPFDLKQAIANGK